ncbi:hypothetical protein ACJX0J_016406, partial [Zea mays]
IDKEMKDIYFKISLLNMGLLTAGCFNSMHFFTEDSRTRDPLTVNHPILCLKEQRTDHELYKKNYMETTAALKVPHRKHLSSLTNLPLVRFSLPDYSHKKTRDTKIRENDDK